MTYVGVGATRATARPGHGGGAPPGVEASLFEGLSFQMLLNPGRPRTVLEDH